MTKTLKHKMKADQFCRQSGVFIRIAVIVVAITALVLADVSLVQAQDLDRPGQQMNDAYPPGDGYGLGWGRGREGRRGDGYGPPRGGQGRRYAERGQGAANPGDRIGRLRTFLGFVRNYLGSVQDPYQAVGLAALGIKQFYKKKGAPLKAVDELEKMLEDTTDQKMRNVILFVMRQVFEEERAVKEFMELNRRIIKENVADVEKK